MQDIYNFPTIGIHLIFSINFRRQDITSFLISLLIPSFQMSMFLIKASSDQKQHLPYLRGARDSVDAMWMCYIRQAGAELGQARISYQLDTGLVWNLANPFAYFLTCLQVFLHTCLIASFFTCLLAYLFTCLLACLLA